MFTVGLPTAGGEAVLGATILNAGGGPLNQAATVTFALDGVPCGSASVGSGLGAGETAEVETAACNAVAPGLHPLTVVVDPGGLIAEEVEGNNDLTVEVWFCAAVESCSGEDDDCDGQTDEDWPDVGAACDGVDDDSCPEGAWVCDAAGAGLICDEEPGSGELCNGEDDDCDLAIDEDWTALGLPCEGEGDDGCATGVWQCDAAGTGLVCVGGGSDPVESCDGTDNDCDGDIDEDWPALGDPCTATAGDCSVAGLLACRLDGAGTWCSGEAAGAKEACDGVDNDCDGATDEAFSQLGAACVAGVGACQAPGTFGCDPGGAGVVCATGDGGTPVPEVCGNVEDDDCDGLVDEGCPCSPGSFVPCGSAVGVCAAGAQQCTAEGVIAAACVGATGPTAETCDGLDNDCDGTVDEDCHCISGQQRGCVDAAGACFDAAQVCVGGAWGPCQVGALLTAEVCNGKDDDCDGLADEGCACTPGLSRPCADPPVDCGDYLRTCGQDGAWSACELVPGSGGGAPPPACGGSEAEDPDPADAGPGPVDAAGAGAGTDATGEPADAGPTQDVGAAAGDALGAGDSQDGVVTDTGALQAGGAAEDTGGEGGCGTGPVDPGPWAVLCGALLVCVLVRPRRRTERC